MTGNTDPTRGLEPGWHERAAEHAVQLLRLYRKLDDLASGQQRLIDDSSTDELLDLLSRRSGVIDQIKELADELAPVISGWDRLGASVPEPVRSSLQEAFADIGALTETILDRDAKHTEALNGQKNEIAKELTSVDRGRAAVSAYSGRADKRPQEPHFQDRQG